MFDERAALRMRLEQMEHAEERILSEFQKERAFIYNRLRELDKRDNNQMGESSIKLLEKSNIFLAAPNETDENEEVDEKINSSEIRPRRKSKTALMRETAVNVLKERNRPMRGFDLKKQIEDQTGFHIANMTTFMKALINTDPNVTKIGRGLYSYRSPVQDDRGTIYLGMDEFDERPMTEL